MEKCQGILKELQGYIQQRVLGKEKAIKLLLIGLMCEGHVLIEDVPGVGKTSLVRGLASAVGASFKRIQFTPDLLPSDVIGFSMYNPKTGEFQYKEGAIMGSFVLADEINRTSPKTQSSLLEAMGEKQVTVDGMTYELPKPFMVLATQNPIEQLGTYPLPEAQLDRFFMKISLGYPSEIDEKKILQQNLLPPKESQQSIIGIEAIEYMQKCVSTIHIEERLQEFIVKIVAETRQHPLIYLGVSPRGSIYLMKAAQAHALYEGRSYVLPDDVIEMAPYILSHRLQLKHEAKIGGRTGYEIIEQVVCKVPIPREIRYA